MTRRTQINLRRRESVTSFQMGTRPEAIIGVEHNEICKYDQTFKIDACGSNVSYIFMYIYRVHERSS
jgi:hypothetical protein